MSLPEVLLWQRLRTRETGIKFRRQHPIGPYIVDFYCAGACLAVEIDGAAHDVDDRPERDRRREAYICERGLRIVRVPATEVLMDADGVAERVARLALPLHRPAGGPPPQAPLGEDLSAVLPG